MTQGRAGSVLLAEKIGTATHCLPVYIHRRSDLSESTVQHSHLMFDKHQIKKFIKLFCLRRNVTETILSLIISEHYTQYHQFKDQHYNFLPFEYSNWNFLDNICNSYIRYHRYYAQQIDDNWTTIYYEDMVTQLVNIDQTYVPIYPDKTKLLVNYSEILNYIASWREELLNSQKLFLDTQKSTDIYNLLTPTTML